MAHYWGRFRKLPRRREFGVSRLSLAAMIRTEGRRIAEAHIALGSATPLPRRMERMEELLVGTFLGNHTCGRRGGSCPRRWFPPLV